MTMAIFLTCLQSLNMPQYVQIQVGDFGIDAGAECWKLYSQEHGLDEKTGFRDPRITDGIHSFFKETKKGYFVPRAISLDDNLNALIRAKNGSIRKFFDYDSIEIKVGNSFRSFDDFESMISTQKCLFESEIFRKQTEAVDNLGGFVILNSMGTMAGSILGARVLSSIRDFYPKKTRIAFSDYRENCSNGLSNYYAALFHFNSTAGTDCTFCLDSQKIDKVYRKHYNVTKSPNIHYLTAQAISSLTMFDRLFIPNTAGLQRLTFNLQMSDFLHYPLLTFTSKTTPKYNTWSLTEKAFDSDNCLCSVDIADRNIIGCTFNYKGIINSRTPAQDFKKMKKIERFSRFIADATVNVEYIVSKPKRFIQPGFENVNATLVLASHTTAVYQLFERIARKVRESKRKSFLENHFGEYFNNLENAAGLLTELAQEYRLMDPLDESADLK